MFYFDSIKIANKTINVLKSDIIKTPHFFSLRNIFFSRGEIIEKEQEASNNRNFLVKYLNIPQDNLFIPTQTHTDNVEIIKISKQNYLNTDALISNISDTAILLNFADCTPIIFYDNKKNIAAISHAGWRGTVQKIVIKTIQKLQVNFNSDLEDISVAIGPSIGKCCYCVDKKVFEELANSCNQNILKISNIKNINGCDKFFVDLKKINEIQLREIGVTNIDISEFCTSCNNDLFFSYRKENGQTYRHSAVIKINKKEEKLCP